MARYLNPFLDTAKRAGHRRHIQERGELVRFHLSAGLTPDVERILGRKPITLEQFVGDHAKCWG